MVAATNRLVVCAFSDRAASWIPAPWVVCRYNTQINRIFIFVYIYLILIEIVVKLTIECEVPENADSHTISLQFQKKQNKLVFVDNVQLYNFTF